MSFAVLIPDEIDITAISQLPNESGIELNPDKLAWIISLFTEPNYTRGTWYISPKPGTRYMQKMFRDYQIYVNHLLDNNILVTDGSYSKGFPREFYFHPDAVSDGYRCRAYNITDNILERKLRAQLHQINDRVEKTHGFLTRWFNESLTIDYQSTLAMLAGSSDDEVNDDHIWAVERINNRQYFFSVSEIVGRFHSPITSLKKDLRKYLRYNDKRIQSFDIKNSVPYLSTFFLQQSFYQEKQAGVPNIQDLGDEFISYINRTNSGFIPYMQNAWAEEMLNTDVARYIDVCRNGGFYEVFENRLRKEFDITFPVRKQLKIKVLEALFSKDTPSGRVYKGFHAKWVFKQEFPTVYNLFRHIKQDEKRKNLLPRMLMKYESVFMIDTIAKGFVNRYKKIPVWTIHDNIATTEDHLNILLNFYKEKCIEHLGMIPRYEIENWY